MRLIWLSIALLAILPAGAQAKRDVVKDPEGKTVGVFLDCDSCKEAGDEACESGAEDGFQDGVPCGQCLINANYGSALISAYDLHIFGFLKDESGDPVEGRFVRLYMPKGWTVRTRSVRGGLFILRVGATMTRKSTEPIVVKLGDRKVKKDSDRGQYSLFLLRDDYQPCAEKK